MPPTYRRVPRLVEYNGGLARLEAELRRTRSDPASINTMIEILRSYEDRFGRDKVCRDGGYLSSLKYLTDISKGRPDYVKSDLRDISCF